ncbi:MAG: heavy metal translocating P-type ATPase [Bacteroidota bacterium]|nr:heavy metal translocating P-type ATPase [Bacteroidota bacterium]
MKKYQLKNIDCALCAKKIEDGLKKLDEVRFVSVNFANSSLTVDTDDMLAVKRTIKELEPDIELIELDTQRKVKYTLKSNSYSTVWEENRFNIYKIISTFILLIIGIIFEDQIHDTPFRILEFGIFIIAYLLSGWKVLSRAIKNILRGRLFDENFLMTIATLGAFAIHQMPEAVAVMWFYVVGELFQDLALKRSRRSIKALLQIRPDYANLKVNGKVNKVSPFEVVPGQIIVVKPGEKIPLDGKIIEGNSFVNTAVLTGESVPRSVKINDTILAGMINISGLLTITVTKRFNESSISRILELVENASSKKANTEKFITSFARYYTPIVVFGALFLAVIPPLIYHDQTFNVWIYRALVILVISCPCALVISIPLGYFGGIGGASKKGILIKGSNILDALNKIVTVVFDKTGTLTRGEFKVSEIISANGYMPKDILKYAAYAESNSNHPIAHSIVEAYDDNIQQSDIGKVEEISGYGIHAIINNDEILIGNDKLLHKENIIHDKCDVEGTVVHVAINKNYAGYIIISDSLKDEASETIKLLNKLNINTVMLTGDNNNTAKAYADRIGIKEYYAELLPEEKVEQIVKILNSSPDGKVAFVGDGINDAPVIARADVGIAMGALGSDAAIEAADVVLMLDSPMLVVKSIEIAKRTRMIIMQNILFAMAVKLLFIIFGTLGIATMWEAVFGDMGVAIMAILNSMRALK